MTRIDRVLKELSDLYEFNQKIKAYQLKKKSLVVGDSRPADDKCGKRGGINMLYL